MKIIRILLIVSIAVIVALSCITIIKFSREIKDINSQIASYQKIIDLNVNGDISDEQIAQFKSSIETKKTDKNISAILFSFELVGFIFTLSVLTLAVVKTKSSISPVR